MDDSLFEGSLVLERLAEIDRVEEFFDAVDSENYSKMISLMRRANLDSETIQWVIKRVQEDA